MSNREIHEPTDRSRSAEARAETLARKAIRANKYGSAR